MTYVTLRRRSDFDRVFRRGQRRRSGGVAVVRGPGPRPGARVGFVTPRAVGHAVDRNRVKRRLREAAKMVKWEPGSDYVIIGSGDCRDVPFEVLVGWLREATSCR